MTSLRTWSRQPDWRRRLAPAQLLPSNSSCICPIASANLLWPICSGQFEARGRDSVIKGPGLVAGPFDWPDLSVFAWSKRCGGLMADKCARELTLARTW